MPYNRNRCDTTGTGGIHSTKIHHASLSITVSINYCHIWWIDWLKRQCHLHPITKERAIQGHSMKHHCIDQNDKKYSKILSIMSYLAKRLLAQQVNIERLLDCFMPYPLIDNHTMWYLRIRALFPHIRLAQPLSTTANLRFSPLLLPWYPLRWGRPWRWWTRPGPRPRPAACATCGSEWVRIIRM